MIGKDVTRKKLSHLIWQQKFFFKDLTRKLKKNPFEYTQKVCDSVLINFITKKTDLLNSSKKTIQPTFKIGTLYLLIIYIFTNERKKEMTCAYIVHLVGKFR